MTVVYIAGPITAESHWEMEHNIRAAEWAWFALAKAGIPAICPHTQGRFCLGCLPHGQWMQLDLELLSRCDVVLVVGDDQDCLRSAGVCEELQKARELGKRICFSVHELIELYGGAK